MSSPVKAEGSGNTYRHWLLAILTLSIVLMSVSAAPASVRKSRIYYGDPYDFSNPGEIKAISAFNAISEFQRIKQERIRPSDAEYWILMRKANRKFRLALKRVSIKCEYDLIGEIGSIRIDADVPDITGEVIIEIKAMQK